MFTTMTGVLVKSGEKWVVVYKTENEDFPKLAYLSGSPLSEKMLNATVNFELVAEPFEENNEILIKKAQIIP